MNENELSRIIVDSAFKIHTTLGPGLLESVYEAVLGYELKMRGCEVICQQAIPVIYEDVKLDLGFRADLIVNRKVVIEVKSIEAIAPVHAKQLRTYLRLMDLRLGLLINFNVNLIKDGIQRVVITFRRIPRKDAKSQRRKAKFNPFGVCRLLKSFNCQILGLPLRLCDFAGK